MLISVLPGMHKDGQQCTDLIKLTANLLSGVVELGGNSGKGNPKLRKRLGVDFFFSK